MDILETALPQKAIFLKCRNPSNGELQFFANDQLKEEDYPCREANRNFLTRPTTEHDMGLFLDTYSARNWVAKHSKNKRVLNLFAYTCAFGVASALSGGEVTNIDPNQDYLDWGKDNARLNGIDFRNLKDTTQKYLSRHERRVKEGKDRPYDLIITDPPAFLVGRGKDRLGRKIWPSMLSSMKNSGCKTFLLICNDRSFLSSRPWHPYLHEQLGKKVHLEDLQQSFDVLGRAPNTEPDPHYHPPKLTIARLG
jgi:23S rRNA G2069 N7-methylase RlmK/C1962 C5-methylase RlmI